MLTQEEELYYTLAGWTPHRVGPFDNLYGYIISDTSGVIVNGKEVRYESRPFTLDTTTSLVCIVIPWHEVPESILDRLKNLVNGRLTESG